MLYLFLCRLVGLCSDYCHSIDALHSVVALLLGGVNLLAIGFNSYELKQIKVTEQLLMMAQVCFVKLGGSEVRYLGEFIRQTA